MNLIASPPPHDLIWDRDQDLTHTVTLDAALYGSFLPATTWDCEFSVTHPTTGAALFTAKTVGAGVTITNPGSATVDAVFTIAVTDADTAAASVSLSYDWKFKRSTSGSEVNMDGGKLRFRR